MEYSVQYLRDNNGVRNATASNGVRERNTRAPTGHRFGLVACLSNEEQSYSMTFNLECTVSRFEHDGCRVHQYGSGADTFHTNAFIVETAKQLVIIDTMMTVSEARGLKAYAGSIGKPLAAILITHGHPDHYNGVGQLRDIAGKVPVITTRAVNAAIHGSVDSKALKWKPIFGAEWPDDKFAADRFMATGEAMWIDGLRFELMELGKGESACDTCWLVGESRRAVFVGDVVFNGVHSFMNDGHSTQWLHSLTQLESILMPEDSIYTGHGQPGVPAMAIPEQRRYLEHYRQTVRLLACGRPWLDEAAKGALVREMNAYLGTDKLAVFVQAGADAVARELAEQRPGD